MARVTFILATTLSLLAALPAAAKTDLPCAPRNQIVTVLLERFKEMPQSMGRTLDGIVVEVFVSQTQSWTILLTTANGMSCIAAAGDAWTEAIHKPGAGI